MLGKLFLLFTLIPVLELYLIFRIGGVIGPLPTIAIIVLTGTLGAYLAKSQGLEVLRRINRATAEGRIPGDELVDGLMILVGGATLLTPGFVTDILGLTLLFPPTRRMYRRLVTRHYRRKVMTRHGIVDVTLDDE